MQDNYTTKGKHLTIDSRRLIERWKKKENQIEKLPLYLEKFLKLSTPKSSLSKELKEKILHYHNQKFSPEMMVRAKEVNVGISTIYYWIHHGKLRLTKQDLLYPRKGKSVKKQASTNFKPADQSIES